MNHIEVQINLPIESVANKRWHWAKLHSYHKARRLQAWALLRQKNVGKLLGPVKVTITRISPRTLDGHDNLRSGCKGLVDGVADWLGVPDSDPRIEWAYAQERGAPKVQAARVRVEWQ